MLVGNIRMHASFLRSQDRIEALFQRAAAITIVYPSHLLTIRAEDLASKPFIAKGCRRTIRKKTIMGLGYYLATSLFANKLTNDNRNPFATLNFWGYRVKVLPPELEFQSQMLFLINAQIVTGLLFGFIIWFSIIQPIQQRKDGKIPLSSLVIGLGLLIPASLVLPFLAYNSIDLRSIPLRFGCFFIPILIPFKCLDAMFGADSEDRRLRMASLQHYLYYSFQIMPKYSLKNDDDDDEATVKHKRIVVPCTFQSTMHNFWKFNMWFFVSILYYQIFAPFNFAPFPETNPDRDPVSDLYPTFELSRLCNNYIQFLAFFLSILFAFYGVAIYNELMGRMQIKGTSPFYFASGKEQAF